MLSHSVVSDSLQPDGLWPARLLSPVKNTGAGFHSLLQGNLPHPGIEPGSPALQVDSLLTELSGKPKKNGEGDIWEKTYKREWMSNVDTKENCNLGNVNSK